ncbi:MAG: ketoacyl-ACP synthase III [Gemmatimonadota bacterium]
MTERVRILGIAAALPPDERSSEQVEALVAESSPQIRVRHGCIEAITGIRSRRIAHEDVQCSDLAADAARHALAAAGMSPADVDVLIFAAAGQDLLEPATANIVQEKTGTHCQVFDVKNACNSFLTGLQLGEALILSGGARSVLVTTGEVCSRVIAWRSRNRAEFKRNFPGFTMGDAGAAAVLAPSGDGRGIFYRRFATLSEYWPLATIPGGGSMHPCGDDNLRLRGDGGRLKQAFLECGTPILAQMINESGARLDDFRRIFVHQASVPYLEEMLIATGLPRDRLECTIANYGNMASASIPVAFALAVQGGTVRPGDRVMWIGLASGISVGVIMMDL